MQQHLLSSDERELLLSIDPWALVGHKGPTRYADEIHTDVQPYDEFDTKRWQMLLDASLCIIHSGATQSGDSGGIQSP